MYFDASELPQSATLGIESLFGGLHGMKPTGGSCIAFHGERSKNGPAVQLPGLARSMDFPVPVRGGDAFTIELDGEPGDLATVGLGVGDLHVPLLDFHGVLLVEGLGTSWLAVLDAEGEGAIALATPPMLDPTFAPVLRFPCGFVTPELEIRPGPARHQVLLASTL